MRKGRLLALLGLLTVAACRPAADSAAPSLRVFSSNGVRALLEDLQPELERAADRPVAVEFSTAAALRRRIEAGDIPDVAVLTSAMVDELATHGKLAADSRRGVARVGVGVGVRSDAPDADVSTPDGLKALLEQAQSVTFTAEGQSRAAIDRAFERLGLVEAMRAKTILKGPGEAPGLVASGGAEVVLTLVSEMVEVPGLKVLGPFPAGLQQEVTFTAARGHDRRDAAAADRLVQAMSGPTAATRLAGHGLMPATP